MLLSSHKRKGIKMNKVLKKICTGIIAGTIAICGVLALDGSLASADSLRQDACTGVNYALGGGAGNCDGYQISSVWGWVYTIVNWVLIAVGILCVVFIIIGAVKFITSGGDPEKTKSGRNTIMYAVIGLVIAILANVIVQIVFNFTDAIVR